MRMDQRAVAYYDGTNITVVRDDENDSQVITGARNRNQAIQALFDNSWYAVFDADWETAKQGEIRIRVTRFC